MGATDKPAENWYVRFPAPVTDEIAEQAFRALWERSDEIVAALGDAAVNEDLTAEERHGADLALTGRARHVGRRPPARV